MNTYFVEMEKCPFVTLRDILSVMSWVLSVTKSVQYVLLRTICHTALALTTKDMESRTSSQQKIFWFLNPDLYSIIFSKIDWLADP